MKEAISKAIEGGWKPKRTPEHWLKKIEFLIDYFDGIENLTKEAFLDPLFWQCLGKGLGWKDDEYIPGYGEPEMVTIMWLHQWHSFIDHLASGQDAESFFNQLLK